MSSKRHRKHKRSERNSYDYSSSEGDACDDYDSDEASSFAVGDLSSKPTPAPGPKQFAKAEFNKNRKIIVRNVPPVKYEVRVSAIYPVKYICTVIVV